MQLQGGKSMTIHGRIISLVSTAMMAFLVLASNPISLVAASPNQASVPNAAALRVANNTADRLAVSRA